jgi:hypothetical protein
MVSSSFPFSDLDTAGLTQEIAEFNQLHRNDFLDEELLLDEPAIEDALVGGFNHEDLDVLNECEALPPPQIPLIQEAVYDMIEEAKAAVIAHALPITMVYAGVAPIPTARKSSTAFMLSAIAQKLLIHLQKCAM